MTLPRSLAVVALLAMATMTSACPGPPGPKGDKGEKGDKGDPGPDLEVRAWLKNQLYPSHVQIGKAVCHLENKLLPTSDHHADRLCPPSASGGNWVPPGGPP